MAFTKTHMGNGWVKLVEASAALASGTTAGVTSSAIAADDLNELAKALPFSIATVLADNSSGLDATSCNELKNLPINVPRSLSLGSNMFSNLFNLST